jgi:uncharacterized membrane protein YbhN (UPF0104 family)
MHIPKALVVRKTSGSSARLRRVGAIISVAITATTVFVLWHALQDVNYNEVTAAIGRTSGSLVGLALGLVAISYGSLTLYDLLALRTIGRDDVPYRIAAIASFTSYPIAHGVGAVAFIAPIIRYRIYSPSGLSVFDVANISFLTGLTFWLGNVTALGGSLFCEPSAIGLINYLPPQLNRMLATALLLGVLAFLIWTWILPRSFGTRRWPVRLPSGPVVLLQITIGVFDLGAAALAMYVLLPSDMNVGLFRLTAVFIAATLLGFASHSPAGLGVFDAAILIGLEGDREGLVAALLMFRLLYHLLPFVLALGLFGGVEAWRSARSTHHK